MHESVNVFVLFFQLLHWCSCLPSTSTGQSLECGCFVEAKIFESKLIDIWARSEQKTAPWNRVILRCLAAERESTSVSRWKGIKCCTWLTKKTASSSSQNFLILLFVIIESWKMTRSGGNYEVWINSRALQHNITLLRIVQEASNVLKKAPNFVIITDQVRNLEKINSQ